MKARHVTTLCICYRLHSIELMKRPFGKTLHRFRRQIERDFGNLVSFGGGLACLPPWVRRITRVRNWVHAKILVSQPSKSDSTCIMLSRGELPSSYLANRGRNGSKGLSLPSCALPTRGR